jgi:putative protease
MEEKRKGEYFPVYENDRGTYLLSSKDLCMVEHLEALFRAGVGSFKIEGRMKGINYTAGVVKVYREAVDLLGEPRQAEKKERWLRELSMFSSRGYTTGMFFGRQPDSSYNFDEDSYRMSHELVGIVAGIDGGLAEIRLRNRLDLGDRVEYLAPGLEEKLFAVGSMRDHDGAGISSARNGDVVYFRVPEGVRENDLIRRPKDVGEMDDGSGGVTKRNTMAAEGCL